tara:strand:+ start:560 stop:757 length:198 start_codon:yes stop_codon:yes gene_type:complete
LKKKLKVVKCTTQELEGIVTLISGIDVKVGEGAWVFEMHKKFVKAFDEAAKADPEYEQIEEAEVG